MLIDDLCSHRAEVLQVIYMLCIHQHSMGEGAGLVTGALMGLVEERHNFWILRQHDLIEMLGKHLSASLEDGDGGSDDGLLGLGDGGALQIDR